LQPIGFLFDNDETSHFSSREIFYELKIDKMKDIYVWLEQFRKMMEDMFQQLDEVLFTIKNKKK
jgi:hypothetical protein